MLSKQLTHRTLIRYDEIIGHRYVPNLKMRIPYSEKPYYIKTNKQGFRSNFDYLKDNKQKEKRIIFLGDSFTAGDGVANEKRFSDILTAKFGAKSYNFGLSGSGVDQQFLIYKHIASRYDHDILVISPHIGDIIRNLMSSRMAYEAESGKQFLVPKPYFTIENDRLKLHNSPVPKKRESTSDTKNPERMFQPTDFVRNIFHKYVPRRIKEKMLKFQLSNQHAGYENENDPRWILMRKLLEGIVELAGDKEIILAPLSYHRIGVNPQYQERFINLAEQYKNVHFVDILDEFKKVKDTDSLYFAKDHHYSEYTHQIIADTISSNILGLNLLEQAKIEKPELNKTIESSYILGISAFYHDSASALIKNGKIIAAAQEERFTRLKNDAGFPYKAINYCLEEAGIHIDDLKAVVFYDHPYLTLERIIASQIVAYPKGKEIWTELFPKWVQAKMHIPEIIRNELNYKGDIHFVKHHLSHAASAFYASPFTKAAILTIDGVGEWATATISYGENTEIKMLKEMNYPNSLGLLYSAFTFYTGFKVNEGEYKLMGLAPYGKPNYVNLIKDKLVKIHDDGSITLNMKYFGFEEKLCMINENFKELFGGPARKKDEQITNRIRDIAKSIQVVTEEVIIKMAKYAKEITGADYLCLAGGVALNCVANGKLLKENLYKDIWIQPAAGDAGGALGSALSIYYRYFNDENLVRKEGECIQLSSYWGPSFSDDEIRAYLDSHDFNYKELDGKLRNKILAKYIAEGKIVGHFSGRMEFGPRALGSRSILGDARNEKAQSILNLKIKFRESFRPFAPTVLEKDVSEYFELDRPSPYMLLVANVKKDRCIKHNVHDESDLIKIVNQKRSALPAITHVDYSARVQSINKNHHKVYYDLISEFKNLTGCGVIINTSFNVNREPIICTPKNAVSCFMTTDMDILVMNNFLLIKEDQKVDDIEQYRFSPPQKKHTQNEFRKAQKDAKKIFEKYISKTENYNTSLKPFIKDSSSTWSGISNHDYFDIFEVNKQLDVTNILDKWEVFSDELKLALQPMLEDIVTLSKKYKIDMTEMEKGISDSIYTMF